MDDEAQKLIANLQRRLAAAERANSDLVEEIRRNHAELDEAHAAKERLHAELATATRRMVG